ncbi:MAG TPA: hypothetical protein ENI81_04470, partial [Phycisphaerales bacterium]|nr:hypothetical protein [Phycisphaerales bacterium]
MRAPICASLGFSDAYGDIRPAFCATGGIEKMLLWVFAAILLLSGLVFGAPPELPAATGITTVSSSADSLSLRVSLPMTGASNVLMLAGQPYIPAGAGGSAAAGEPDVPVFAEWVLIPNGTQYSLRIDPGKPVVYDNVDIPPVQPPRLNSKWAPAPDLTINTITYSTDGDFPGVLAEVGPVKNVRGQQCAIMRLYPYQYNPVARRLSVYPDLEVSLQFEGTIRPASRRL